MVRTVRLSRGAEKSLRRIPRKIVDKLLLWVSMVEGVGLEHVRKTPGFHDEPLKGRRQGQRSIRLNRDYRAIYIILKDGALECVSVEEVSKHEY